MTQFFGPMTDKQKKKIQACRKVVEQHPQDAKAKKNPLVDDIVAFSQVEQCPGRYSLY
jgi:hypothetical protein